MKKDEKEMMYLIGWVVGTCLTFLVAYFCFPLSIIPSIVAHGCAAMIIFRVDDDSDRGGDEAAEPDPDPGMELDIPKDELRIKRVGNNDFDKKKSSKYDFSSN